MPAANTRTDLAVESFDVKQQAPQGITVNEEDIDGIKVTRITIENEQGAKSTGKPCGRYITINLSDFKSVPDDFKKEVEVTANELKKLLPENGTVLIAGLGNSDITPDSIGPLTVSMIFATRHISKELADEIGLSGLRSVAAITPGVLGQTGMETGEIISSVCKNINPVAVIAVDALAALSIDRLGRTIQISDTGIIPGSGVQNARKELNRALLGIPVISLGIPTVADMSSILYELSEGAKNKIPEKAHGMMITPKEIDVISERAAKAAAYAINRALHPNIDIDTLEALIA